MELLTLLTLLVIVLPWIGAVAVWITGDRYPRLQNTLSVFFSAMAAFASIALIINSKEQTVTLFRIGGVFGNITFWPDGIGVFLAAVATIIGCLAVIFSIDYMKGEAQLGRYYAMVLFFIGAMAGLVLSSNLLFVFIFWEITAFCSYALISFHNDDPKAVAGGIKALIITQFGGIGLLAGALLIYSYLNSFDIQTFLQTSSTFPEVILAWIAFGFLAAAAAKSAQFPFHTWLPDAMEAPTPVSALIHAATMVNAGVYLLARFCQAFKDVPGWSTSVVAVGAITALLAAVMALVSYDLKRVLAYSTVSQLGYMVYAIGTGGVFESQFHLLSHSVFKALLFLGAGAVIHAVGTRDMREMGGLGKHMPLVRNVFITGALALAGIPIFNGFWSKELILETGLSGGPLWAYILLLIGAGLTALYTFRVVWMVFYGKAQIAQHPHDAGTAMRVALIPLALATLTIWLLVGPFSELLQGMWVDPAGETIKKLGEVLGTPMTLVALLVIAAGMAAWWWRDRLSGITNRLKVIGQVAKASFGFEAINRGVITAVQDSGEALRATQTGLLNWNVVGILAALIVVLVLLVWGV